MKTTLEMPDGLYRRLKSHAAERGTSIKKVLTEAVEEKLDQRPARNGQVKGWRSVFGTVPKSVTAEIDAVIEKEFEQIDPADWK